MNTLEFDAELERHRELSEEFRRWAVREGLLPEHLDRKAWQKENKPWLRK